jgi:predicted flap endonuclease-1-like 5' DNA nuclease
MVMPEFLTDYWLPILIALAVLAILAFLLLRPRQRVQLTDTAPVRPHMAHRTAAPQRSEGHGITDEVAAAASDVTGDILNAPVHSHLPGASGPPDDLQRLKGVGPKFAELLNERGIIRFEQLARLTPNEVERLDSTLGAFRGRIARDRIVEQADYLARGDVEGFEHLFGKL